MSKMLRLELVGLVLLACTQILTEHRDFLESRSQYGYQQRYHERMTKEVQVKQGWLRGMVVQPRTNQNLQLVDVFLGVPYADAPIGSLRYVPPKSPRSWSNVRQAQNFAPVCPQLLPKPNDTKSSRYEYVKRHLPYLKNQSEDCLYLNIYAPHQSEGPGNLKRYPVIIFIHGESLEYNSGNPYDGTILAAYGNVVFVTINFRLGILGFLKPGIGERVPSNFGLFDQIAALEWLRENIAAFGGDPNSFTLMGHGTGAIFANLLLISPVATLNGQVKRAILMSGSALSADAIGTAPMQMTKQVASAVDCNTTNDSELIECLRNKTVDTLLKVVTDKPEYVPAFPPLIDDAVITDKPFASMAASTFGRFDLMYGVSETEKFHILSPNDLQYGMSDKERDEILLNHAKATHKYDSEKIVAKILEHYGGDSQGFNDYYKNRKIVLDALSDSGTVAPLIITANLHSRVNPKSYMYVFSHPKAVQDYSGQQEPLGTVHGEELPYVLGVPLDNGKYVSHGRYSIAEALFSEAMMNWWSSFAYIGNPNVAKRSPYLTKSSKEWEQQYDIDWPEYDLVNQTYLNLTIPPKLGSYYRSEEMQFWNENLPNMLQHPDNNFLTELTELTESTIFLPSQPKGPRPDFLDIADGIRKDPNDSLRRTYEIQRTGYTTKSPSTMPETDKGNRNKMYPLNVTWSQSELDTTPETAAIRSSSAITMVIGFGIVFLLINLTAFFYLYRKKQGIKPKDKTIKRRLSQKDDSSKRPKIDKYENHYGELGYKSDSKPDLNDVIKNDKAYDNNSNFGRRSKLSRQNSNSTIDTHIKVREWIQQEIVHRCSPRFLRKTRETLQKEHQEKITKQQQEEKERIEQEIRKEKLAEPIYDESPTIVVRPGKKSKAPKVSVAVDATPATRTESVLNQIPIELAKSSDPTNEQYETNIDFPLPDPIQLQIAPQVVVIEHHHSRSDPLPMETVMKHTKPNFSTTRIYESDSGSASSLYAKINPRMKSRLPRPDFFDNLTNPVPINEDRSTTDETYIKSGPKLTTFGTLTCDVNVTCREPTVERECVSPEEALRTIKRRNYPKVLPDIEKRRSLPVPSSLFIPKQYGNSLKDYKGIQNLYSNQPPLPPPRMFGPSKSLEFPEESETQLETESITTNLHVGPLLKRQDPSMRNNSDPSIIDSFENSNITNSVQSGGSADAIYTNPKCPIHGEGYSFQPTSHSVEHDIGHPRILLESGIGNPNWYKPIISDRETPQVITPALSEPRIVITARDPEKQLQLGNRNPNWDTRIGSSTTTEPRIVITPRLGNLPGLPTQNLNQMTSNFGSRVDESKDGDRNIVATKAIPIESRGESRAESRLESSEHPGIESSGIETKPTVKEIERKEPRIIITQRDPKNSASNLKQPKIIIKPTTTLQRNRDQRNIPKVSAIPSSERLNYQNTEKDRIYEQKEGKGSTEKPPSREKPKVTRIPSFSRRKEDTQNVTLDKSTTSAYPEKTEIIQRIEAVPGTVTSIPLTPPETKSYIPTLQKANDKSSSTDSSNGTGNSNNSNTGTVKRKPTNKK